jgi:hypothetical protein
MHQDREDLESVPSSVGTFREQRRGNDQELGEGDGETRERGERARL